MRTNFLIFAGKDREWKSALPAAHGRLAAALTRTGVALRLIDYAAEPVRFGYLAELVESHAPNLVVFAADASSLVQLYRVGRFLRSANCNATFVYCCTNGQRCTDDPFTLGEADAILEDLASVPIQRLVDGWPLSEIAGVRDRHASRAAIASASGTDQLSPATELFDLQQYRSKAVQWAIPHSSMIGIDARAHRPIEPIVQEAIAASACDRLILFEGHDLFEDAHRVTLICDALRDAACTRWIAEVPAASVLTMRAELLRVRASGCVALACYASTIGSGPVDLERAATAIRAAGLCPVLRPIWLMEGDTIDSIAHMTRTLARMAHEAPILGRFSTDTPDESAGRTLAHGPEQHTSDFPVCLPQSLLDDIPQLTPMTTDEARRGLHHVENGRIAAWVASGMLLPGAIFDADFEYEKLRAAAGALLETIDGTRTVAALLASAATEEMSEPALYSAFALLVLCDLIRGRDSLFRPAANGFFCSRPWTGFEIGEEDGLVRMCCWARDSYGDVNKSSLAEIWNGPVIQHMRRRMAAGRYDEICRRDCPYIAGWMRDEEPSLPLSPDFLLNLERSREDIAQRREIASALPRYWKITHSTLCNLDCIMCYQDRNEKRTLPDSFYRDLEAYYPAMQELLLLGGEPLVTRRIRALLGSFPAAKYPDLRFALITNGTIFDPKTLALFEDKQLSWLVISIDAAREETYAHIRRKGNLSKVLAGVAAWTKLGRSKGFPVVLSFTVMRDNLCELADFVTLADSQGVDCQFSVVSGTKGDQHLIDFERLQQQTQEALARIEDLRATARMPIAASSLRSLVN